MADKIFITGPHLAGKTQFVQTISEAEPLPDYLARPDYGQITINDNTMLYLLGSPGQLPLEAVVQVIAEELLGAVLVVDSTAIDTFANAAKMLEIVRRHTRCIVAANKEDMPNALSPAELRIHLHAPADVVVLPCIATERDSVKAVLVALLESHPDQALVSALLSKLTQI